MLTIAVLIVLGCLHVKSESAPASLLDIVDRYCQTGHHRRPLDLSTPALIELIDLRIDRAMRERFPASCREANPKFALLPNNTGGIFRTYTTEGEDTTMYCDTETDGGGWTVFQRRMDGSVNFQKNWQDYVNGFGNKQGEFWLGLEKIHQITSDGVYELRVDMVERNGVHHYAKYSSFSLGPSSDYYRLSVSGFSGNATDSLEYHNNLQFSTYDSDHDNSGNCASYWRGAWWYNACYYSHLNGEFTGDDGHAMQWWHKINPTGWELPSRAIFLKFSEMKFRKVET